MKKNTWLEKATAKKTHREEYTVRTAARNAPIYLTDGTREAIVMPVCS